MSKEYTLMVDPRRSGRRNAGPYDPKTNTPRYEEAFDAPSPEARRSFHIESKVMGTEGNYLWVWEFRNDSTWPIFLTLKKDGVVQR